MSGGIMQTQTNTPSRRLERILTLLLAAAIMPGCDSFRSYTDAEYVVKAKAAWQKGDVKATMIDSKNALLKNPDNAEARVLLGEANLALGHGADAESDLRKALDLGAKRDDVLLPLARSLLAQKKNQQLIDEITVPLSSEADMMAKVLVYRGEAWLGLNRPKEAKSEFERALAADSKQGLAKLGLARIALADKNLDDALSLAKDAAELSPGEVRVWDFLGEIYTAKGDMGQAEASYGKAIELPSPIPNARINRALLRLQMNKLEEASQDVEVLKKKAPQFFMTHFVDGLYRLAQKKYPEAQAALEETLRLNDNYGLARYYLALSQFYQQHWAQAEVEMTKFLVVSPNSINAQQVMAVLKLRQKEYDAAKKYIAPVLLQLPDDAFSIRISASIEMALGNHEQGLIYLKKLAQLEPNSAQAQADLGMSLLGMGRNEEGLKDLQAAANLDASLVENDAYLILAYLKDKKYEQAQAALEKMKQKLPKSALPQDLQGVLYASKNDMEGAKRSFELAFQINPKDLSASSNLAQFAIRENNIDRAIELYRQILKDHPQHVPAYLALAEISTNKANLQEAETYLKQAVGADPHAAKPRLLLAQMYTYFGQASQALAMLEPVRVEQRNNAEFVTALTEALLRNNDKIQALESAQNLSKIEPNSAVTQYLLASAFWQNGEIKHMRTSLEASLKLDPKFSRARLAMVRLLAQENKNDEAKKYLEAIKAELPANDEIWDVQGWLAMRQGKPGEAAKIYKAALEKFPRTYFVSNLARAYWAEGRKEVAISTLDEWVGQHANDVDARFLLSNFYFNAQQPEKGKSQLEAILAKEPNNVLALNDLAWLIRAKQPREAEEYAQKAMSLAPASPDVLDTLGVILMENGQNSRALNLIEQAYSFAPNRPGIIYHLAQAYEESGRIDDAKKALASLLQMQGDFKEKREAEQMLSRLEK
jgi:putative PEP-CTERM system TPR-repeat lipoprotein